MCWVSIMQTSSKRKVSSAGGVPPAPGQVPVVSPAALPGRTSSTGDVASVTTKSARSANRKTKVYSGPLDASTNIALGQAWDQLYTDFEKNLRASGSYELWPAPDVTLQVIQRDTGSLPVRGYPSAHALAKTGSIQFRALATQLLASLYSCRGFPSSALSLRYPSPKHPFLLDSHRKTSSDRHPASRMARLLSGQRCRKYLPRDPVTYPHALPFSHFF